MELTIDRTFPQNLADEWNALLAESVSDVPFLRYEYLRAWWQTRGGGEWPQAELFLVTARREGRLSAAAPLFFTPDHQGRPALMLAGSIEVSDYLDLVARPADLDYFLDLLLPFLAGQDLPAWQALDWYNLLDSSPTLPALQAATARLGWRCQVEQLQHSPYIPLPGEWEAYLAAIDKKQRHEIRRKMRRAEESGAAVRWYTVAEAARLEAEIEDFLNLMEQEADKASFLTAEMREHMRLTCRSAFEAGYLHLAFLEIDGKKASAKLSFDYRNRLWAYNSGIERSLMDYSPGWVLLGYLLRWANEARRQEFDFMRGNEDYKYRFGAVDRFVMRATVSR